MSIHKEVKRRYEEDYLLNGQLEMYRDLTLFDNPLINNNEDLAEAINKHFGCNISNEDLYLLDSPSILQMQEDRMLVLKHNT